MSKLRYHSTRHEVDEYQFQGLSEIIIKGMPDDGGLYVPYYLDVIRKHAPLPKNNILAEFATEFLWPFVQGDNIIGKRDLLQCLTPSVRAFESATRDWQDLLPNLKLLELYHSPTLAFKDVAMQFIGPLFEKILARTNQKITIVAATSGDTGSAAIEAFKNRKNIQLIVLFPNGRVSPFQQRQMTTSGGNNIHPIAVNGSFDDCQDLVKACFANTEMRQKYNFSAVNSINWGRIMAQMVYYAYTTHLFGPTNFCVPTGNFGNVLAGFYARTMGAPVKHLRIATNENDILARFFNQNDMSIKPVIPTSSPSMDIQISSNFERLLFEVFNDFEADNNQCAEYMRNFREKGTLSLDEKTFQHLQYFNFSAQAINQQQALQCAKDIYKKTGKLLDPHSAIAVQSAMDWLGQNPGQKMVALGTASPYKFADFAKQVVGDANFAYPDHLKAIFDKREEFSVLDNNITDLFAYLKNTIG